MKKRLSSILIVLSLLLTLLPAQVFAEEVAVESDCAVGGALVEAEVPAPEEADLGKGSPNELISNGETTSFKEDLSPKEGISVEDKTAGKEDSSTEETPLGSTVAAEAALPAAEDSEEALVGDTPISADLSNYLYKYGGFPDYKENVGLRHRYLSVADYAGAETAIVNAFKNWETTVDVIQYKIPRTEGIQFIADVLNRHPELFYSGSSISCAVDSNYILSYDLPYDEAYSREDVAAYEEAVTSALNRVNESMTSLQKALVLHDYLAQHTEYDLTYSNYNSYNALVDGAAVCQGYTMAYLDLLNRAGVPCATSASEAMNHIWNLVQIDGDWYHVDVTWDDPVNDTLGQALHTNFLRSDIGIADAESSGHYGWVDDYDCTSTKYDAGWFWSACNSAIGMVDNTTAYYLSHKSAGGFGKYYIQLIERDWTTGAEVAASSVAGKWIDLKGSSWGVNSYMSCDNGALWFNTNDTVYRYGLMTEELSKVDISSVYSGGDNIYQAVVQEGMLKFAVGDTPDSIKNTYRLKVSGPVVPPIEKENGLVEENGTWYYYVDGVVDTSYIGLVPYNGAWYYVSGGQADFAYTGLSYYQGTWYYVHNGVVDFGYNGIAWHGGAQYMDASGNMGYSAPGWYFILGGEVNWDFIGLTYYTETNTWYYVSGGVVDWNYTGLSYYQGTWRYVCNGVANFDYDGIAWHGGAQYMDASGNMGYSAAGWYFVLGGVVNWDFIGLTYYAETNTWYYVSGGMVNWDYTGLSYYQGTWYYVRNGVADFGYNGIAWHGGAQYMDASGNMGYSASGWYFILGGVVNWDFIGLTYYTETNTWYYVSGGVVDWSYTGLSYYNGTWYYVSGGVVDFGYSGEVYYAGSYYYDDAGDLQYGTPGTYHVVGGVVQF